MEIEGWLSEGTAHRSPVQRTPVIHLLVRGGDGWELWCTGGKGRQDSPHGNRLCRECRALARDAVDRGELDARHARRWLAPARPPTWEAITKMLADRLRNHAYCNDHPATEPDPECPFCEDRAVYLAYCAKAGQLRDGGQP